MKTPRLTIIIRNILFLIISSFFWYSCNSAELNRLQNKVSNLETQLQDAQDDLRKTKYLLEVTEDRLESAQDLLEDTQDDLSRAKSKIWDIEFYTATLESELGDLSREINYFSCYSCQSNMFGLKSELSDVETAFQTMKFAF